MTRNDARILRPSDRGRSLSAYLHGRPRLRLAALLALPLTWLVVVYILSIALMLVTAFWTTDPFTSKVKPGFTLKNFINIFTTEAYVNTSIRTVVIALSVTILCILAAIPLGIFMAKVAPKRWRALLVMAVTLPLWAGYLVKVYAWRISLGDSGPINSMFGPFGLPTTGYNQISVVLVLAYMWFPYMAIPVYAAIAQMPDNLFNASADLGARAGHTIRTVVLPLVTPAVIAGSIFTFSLSLGDYITAQFVGGKTQMIGSVILANINLNPPLAAAYSAVPMAVVLIYLLAVRKTGALNEL